MGFVVCWLIVLDFLQVLLAFMSMPLLRESACDCIHEIILKGMEPMAKTQLIESFCSVLHTNGIFNVSEVTIICVSITISYKMYTSKEFSISMIVLIDNYNYQNCVGKSN